MSGVGEPRRSVVERAVIEAASTVRVALGAAAGRFDVDSALYRTGVVDDLYALEERLAGREAPLVLDAGCGKGILAAALARMGARVLAVDMRRTPGEQLALQDEGWQRPAWQALASRTLTFSYVDGERLPVRPGSIDVVVAYAVIEHIPPPLREAWLSEVHRALRPDGALYVARCPRPLAVTEWLARLLGLPHHEYLVGENELRALLQRAGFRVHGVQRTDMFPEFLPGALQRALDAATGPLLAPLDRRLAETPLGVFAHHTRCWALMPGG